MAGIMVIVCSTLSLLGQMFILGCFIVFKKLRSGLFARVIVYLAVSSIIQTIGILFSSTKYNVCGVFAVFRLYGGLGCIMWSSVLMYCIKQLFGVLNFGGEFEDLKLKLEELHRLEYKFVIFCFGLPLLLVIWPISTQTISEGFDQQYCYIYANQEESAAQQFQIDFQKILFWELPILLYLIYSIIVLNKIKRLFKKDDDSKYINRELTELIKKLVLFPIITLICTFGFTIEDIEAIFYITIPEVQTSISFAFLSFWGFLNCLAYISQDVVMEQLKQIFSKKEEQELKIAESLLNDDEYYNRLSIGSQCYYYKEDSRYSAVDRQIQLIQNDQVY